MSLKKTLEKPIYASTFFFFFLLLSLNSFSQGNPIPGLSRDARVSVITTSPGEDLYTVFGHAAIRIMDSIRHQDWVYGYGEFDFNTPNFYPEFVRGTLLYTISKDPFPLFKQEFLSEPYQMKEQVLNLDSNQKQKIYEILETNILPQNRLYRYDFFYNNCATKIRDVLNRTVPGSSFFSREVDQNAPSFRDLIKTYLIDRPWIRLGTDIILGIPADKHLSPEAQSFLPFYLSQYLGSAKLPNHRKLVSSESYLLNNVSKKESTPLLSPGGYFWLLFMFSLIGIFFKPFGKVFSALLYFLLGILGLLILYLWLGTERSSYGLNLNVLWACPLLLFLPFAKNGIMKGISLTMILILFIFYFLVLLRVQIINPAIIPISLTVLVYVSRPFYPLLSRLYKEDQ